MTVAELIEQLKKYDPNMLVATYGWSHEAEGAIVSRVKTVKQDFETVLGVTPRETVFID